MLKYTGAGVDVAKKARDLTIDRSDQTELAFCILS